MSNMYFPKPPNFLNNERIQLKAIQATAIKRKTCLLYYGQPANRIQIIVIFSGSCDLAFMLDASSSIQGEADFKLCIEFIKTVFHAFGMGGGIRFALVIFGSSAQVVFDFSKYSSISEVDTALSQVRIKILALFFM